MTFSKSYFSIFAIGFIIWITSGNPLSTVPGNPNYYLLIPALFVLYFHIKKRSTVRKKNIALYSYLLLVFLTLSSFLLNLNVSHFSTNVKFLLVITFSYLFCLTVPFEKFSKYYIQVLKAFSIISIIGYIILNLTSLKISLPVFSNANGVEYYNGFIFFAIKSFQVYGNSGINRNIGPFWEPGLFATFILLGIILELWKKEKTSIFTILIFIIALLTTKSTFGYLMFIPIGLEIISKTLGEKLALLSTLLSLVVIAFLSYNLDAIISWLVTMNSEIFSKLIEESNSVNERLEAPLTNIKIFFDNYLYGAGLGNTEELFDSITNVPQTSTSTFFLATFGFLGLSYTLLLIYGILSFKEVRLFSRFIFLTVVFVQINKEPHIYFTTTFILFFYFLLNANTNKPYSNPKYN